MVRLDIVVAWIYILFVTCLAIHLRSTSPGDSVATKEKQGPESRPNGAGPSGSFKQVYGNVGRVSWATQTCFWESCTLEVHISGGREVKHVPFVYKHYVYTFLFYIYIYIYIYSHVYLYIHIFMQSDIYIISMYLLYCICIFIYIYIRIRLDSYLYLTCASIPDGRGRV